VVLNPSLIISASVSIVMLLSPNGDCGYGLVAGPIEP
jgi:hypothetical protein